MRFLRILGGPTSIGMRPGRISFQADYWAERSEDYGGGNKIGFGLKRRPIRRSIRMISKRGFEFKTRKSGGFFCC